MRILNKLSFHKKIFLACLLTALVPLLCSSVVMIRLFTAALERQDLDEGRTQIIKAEARLEAVFEKCEEACQTIAADKKTARTMNEKSEADHQREMYLSLYQATQETSGYAQFSIYDAGGHLLYTTDTEGKEKDLPVFWGLLRKASKTDDQKILWFIDISCFNFSYFNDERLVSNSSMKFGHYLFFIYIKSTRLFI